MFLTACFMFSPFNPSFLYFLLFGTNSNQVNKQVVSIINILCDVRDFPRLLRMNSEWQLSVKSVTARSFLEDSLRIGSLVRSASDWWLIFSRVSRTYPIKITPARNLTCTFFPLYSLTSQFSMLLDRTTWFFSSAASSKSRLRLVVLISVYICLGETVSLLCLCSRFWNSPRLRLWITPLAPSHIGSRITTAWLLDYDLLRLWYSRLLCLTLDCLITH